MAAKRRRLTVNDVLQYCADSDDDAEPEAGFECDFDPDEPVMEGSDDEFSDLEDEYVDEDDPDAMDDPPTDPPAAGSTTRSFKEQQKWSTTTKRLLIHPFTSTVSPTQDISSGIL